MRKFAGDYDTYSRDRDAPRALNPDYLEELEESVRVMHLAWFACFVQDLRRISAGRGCRAPLDASGVKVLC